MTLDLEKLRALLDLLAEKDVAELEHEQDGVRLRISRGARVAVAPMTYASPAAQSVVPPGDAGAVNTATARAPAAEPADGGGDHADVTSPFVGTFYRSPSPDTPSFVEVGSVVRIGQTLCIIEAMKLMNEIEAESAGTVVEIYAQNGKSVEYGQKLFRIKRA
jgi:acetyl-CoA carboxylase biotin carboxyl carrier protein